MANGINRVIIIGRMGNDPELRWLPNGDAVANISLATSESWKDQQGQKQERVEWHRCTAYRKTAEIIGQYLKKGANIYIEGKLRTREWVDQQGQKKYTTEIIIAEMQMLDKNPNAGQPQGGQPQGGYQQPRQQNQPQNNNQPQQQNRAPQQQQQPQGGYIYDPNNAMPMYFDDEIPF